MHFFGKWVARALSAIVAIGLSVSSSAAQALESASAPSARVEFQFHNSFLLNLHGFLLSAARDEKQLAGVQWLQQPDAAERAALDQALHYYRVAFAKQNVLFSDELSAIKKALAQAPDDEQSVQGLSLAASHRAVLRRVAPVYARCLWPTHRTQNAAWITAVNVLNAGFGAEIEQRIEHWLGQSYPRRIRDDVVAYSAFWAGAYTSDAPTHSVIESGLGHIQAHAALEILYHEGSHGETLSPLFDAIAARLPEENKDRDFWHAVQFFTVGEAVRAVLREQGGVEYVPFAEQNGLYQRGRWAQYLPLLKEDWAAFMRGEISRDEALQSMLKKLGY